jgi:hypothetical protein
MSEPGPCPPPKVLSTRWWIFIGVVFISATVVLSCSRTRPTRVERAITYEPVTPEEILQTGMVGEDGGVPRKGIPPEPSPMQQKPPCDPDAEEYEINGACWQATPRKPPCGDKLREHNGACYRAIGVRRRGVSDPGEVR